MGNLLLFVKRIVLAPFFLILLTSCSAVDNYKNVLKEELKTELKSEITANLKEELDKNNKYEINIVDDTLLGVSNFEIEQPSYGGCKVGGNFKFNIKVPKDFTGDISDTEATYLFKGKDKIDSYYESFIDGKSINGTYIYICLISYLSNYVVICIYMLCIYLDIYFCLFEYKNLTVHIYMNTKVIDLQQMDN